MIDNIEVVALGNVGVMDNSGKTELTNEPFLIVNIPSALVSVLGLRGGVIPLDGAEEVALSIYGNITKKISKEFLPNIPNIANIVDGSELGSIRTILASDIIGAGAHAEGANTTASGIYSHAEGYSAKNAFDFITEESTNEEIITAWNDNSFTLASGQSSHAEGRDTLALGYDSHAEGRDTIASGSNSHAEGDSTTASGNCSHAEGDSTTALGNHSHAEGWKTTASGSQSHAEGKSANNAFDFITEESTNEEIITAWNDNKFTLAFGSGAHAEGNNVLALGTDSHAEGYETTAFNNYSHAEGWHTTASGNNSHAEGSHTTASGHVSHAEGFSTIASNSYSHVQGKYNIDDTEKKYAHIVGNGSDTARSNAHTLDWDGNAWYAGDVYVGSTSGKNKDEGSKKLATEEYVMNEITKNHIQIITWEDND